MIAALNGTIKLKASTSVGYTCQQKYCSNEELAALQISLIFLTKDSLFDSVALKMSSKDLNETLLDDLEYDKFCRDNAGELNCIPAGFRGPFFNKYWFGDFEKANLIWSNRNNYDAIEDEFSLMPGTG
jgi:hypothetical protein